ncbi:MAG: hypothetical protein LBI58_01145 [Tannerellaceae bacterium]|jgi:hypothetical protein|nr:hypothetical protein [Tannerellaceae bacterium]
METNETNNNGITIVPNDESVLRATTYTFDYDGETGYINILVPHSGGYVYLNASLWHSLKVVDGVSTTIPYAYYPSASSFNFGTVSSDGNTIYVQPNSSSSQRIGTLIYVQTESGKPVAFLLRQE